MSKKKTIKAPARLEEKKASDQAEVKRTNVIFSRRSNSIIKNELIEKLKKETVDNKTETTQTEKSPTEAVSLYGYQFPGDKSKKK